MEMTAPREQLSDSGWTCVEQMDMTGMSYSEAKPLIEALANGYSARGRRVKVIAKSIVEIMVASDA